MDPLPITPFTPFHPSRGPNKTKSFSIFFSSYKGVGKNSLVRYLSKTVSSITISNRLSYWRFNLRTVNVRPDVSLLICLLVVYYYLLLSYLALVVLFKESPSKHLIGLAVGFLSWRPGGGLELPRGRRPHEAQAAECGGLPPCPPASCQSLSFGDPLGE
jgi:hypothetical protein